MNVKEWLKANSLKYDLKISTIEGDNHFIRQRFQVADNFGYGLSFEMSCNDAGELSVLEVLELFRFNRLNIAEGYEEAFLFSVAESFLDGRLQLNYSRFLRVPYLLYEDQNSCRKIVGKISIIKFFLASGKIRARLSQASTGYKKK